MGATLKSLVYLLKEALFTSKYINYIMILILIMESVLVPVIVWKVPYTEIDWKAYMSEVEGFLNGTRDYSKLRGDTGPLVYPGGFLYIYSILYYLTSRGSDIKLAQVIFSLLYLLNMTLILQIYKKLSNLASFSPVLLLFLSLTGYRVHSIFVLRLFNDTVAIATLHIAILLLINNYWNMGCILYSVAVSIKMNILLYSPGLGFILMKRFGIKETIKKIILCGLVQVVIGSPFLLSHPVSYLMMSFDVTRVFLYKWTVNWRLVPEEVFVSRWFHSSLLIIHLLLIILFINYKWMKSMRYRDLFSWTSNGSMATSEELVYCMYVSNFIGLMVSRSLHYQFYVWYYYTLPILMVWARINTLISMLLLVGMEYCWNVFPSTVYSSLLLHIIHIIIISNLFINNRK
uniref:dolichyl-P-Man:Man5GlcNAc2-PP-dolichol alpha-1,3-mannosyltransferase n=1 Tax=Amphimedon queenslandica TaxID=400682 RepID=A0A1X7TPW9_AMPQE